MASSNETINIGEEIYWYCWMFNDDKKNIDEFIWFKVNHKKYVFSIDRCVITNLYLILEWKTIAFR